MKRLFIFILSISFIGVSISEIAFYRFFLNERKANSCILTNDIEMKYHGTPTYYWTL